MELTLWEDCKTELRQQLSQQTYTQLITPLQAELTPEGIVLWAPNAYVKKDVLQYCMSDIGRILTQVSRGQLKRVLLEVGRTRELLPRSSQVLSTIISKHLENSLRMKEQEVSEKGPEEADQKAMSSPRGAKQKHLLKTPPSSDAASMNPIQWGGRQTRKGQEDTPYQAVFESIAQSYKPDYESNLNQNFTLDNFVVGKANQLAQAAAQQIVKNPGGAYNPFFLYGGVGLGKTHLMHAIGNTIVANSGGKARVIYLHSERFVADMVTALQNNAIEKFKRFYRSMDALLVDDIQFIGNKERTQEEFFHTFNALLEGRQQVILTSDRYPKEIAGLEERLRSRFGSGLTVSIDPPELETRVAILLQKAEQNNIQISSQIAFFIAKNIRSNVRELEGALKRVVANAQFTGEPATLSFVQETLKDLLVLEAKVISLDNIIKVVSEYYKIRITDLLSKKRARIYSRPRQMAMCLCKELTTHSLPEIGEFFGGRDHSTVIHACRSVQKLFLSDKQLAEDHDLLCKQLSE